MSFQNMTYEQWMMKVNAYVLALAFVSVHDLSDFCSYDMWEAGDTPKEAAIEALRNDDMGYMVLEELGLE